MNACPPGHTLRLDLSAFTAEVQQLRDELDAVRGPADAFHLRLVWGTAIALWAMGWAFAWIPNPFSPIAIALARSIRWTCVAHHVLHRGYDRVPGLPEYATSRGFAKGWRRWVDWPDWLEPEAWKREHNQLHHYRLGEVYDPDVLELNSHGIPELPRGLRSLSVYALMFVWKFLYYAPSNTRELQDTRTGHRLPPEREVRMDVSMLSPFNERGREVWTSSWIPYSLWAFVALPMLFLPLGWTAVATALGTSIVAELLTNLHTFIIVVTNHAGGDVYRFEGKPMGKGELWVRQVAGSVNFRTGGQLNDLLHGWLNYQIEHHVFPDLSMRQYQLAQPKLEAICRKHGVPYLQESVFTRLGRVVRVMHQLERSPIMVIEDIGTATATTPPL